jgi:hypothetical protein
MKQLPLSPAPRTIKRLTLLLLLLLLLLAGGAHSISRQAAGCHLVQLLCRGAASLTRAQRG